jgi:hypothetical protein
MILAADGQPAGETVWRGGDGGVRIAQPHGLAVLDERAGGAGILDGQERRQVLIFHDGQGRRGAGLGQGLGGDGEQRLADEADRSLWEHRIIAGDRADVILARNVGSAQYTDDPRRGLHGRKVEPLEPGVCAGALAHVDVQEVRRFRQVVDVERFARHMLLGAVVGDGGVDDAKNAGGRAGISHAPPPRPRGLATAGRSRGMP